MNCFKRQEVNAGLKEDELETGYGDRNWCTIKHCWFLFGNETWELCYFNEYQTGF